MVEVNVFVFWLFGGIQIFGLLSSWLTRVSEGSPKEWLCQCLFLFCLTLVGGATLAAVAMQATIWPLCGATLAIMVLGAVWDFRGASDTDAAQVLL